MNKNLYIPLILIIIAVLALAVFISYNPQIPIPISPTPTPTPTNTITLGEGERDGPLLVQKIYPDHIEGLNFREYPISRGYGENITLDIGQSASNGCTVTLILTNIIQLQTYPPTYKAVFSKKVDTNRPCPICLSEIPLSIHQMAIFP